MRIQQVCVVAVLMVATPALADGPALPDWFPVDGLFSVNPDQLTDETLDTGTFKVENAAGDDYDSVDASGHYWTTSLYPPGSSDNWDAWDGEAAWAKLDPQLEGQGFTIVYLDHEDGSSVDATLRKGEEPGATYVEVFLTKDDAYSNSVTIVAEGGGARTVALTPPAAVAESFGDGDDFPYVTPIAGAKLLGTQPYDAPMEVTASGADEPQFVGTGVVNNIYEGPSDVSPAEFKTIYETAFAKAGWTIIDNDFGSIIAHFAGNGRDVWARLWQEGGDRWDVSVADVGESLKTAVQQCKTELYGVTFDFDKASLKDDAEPILQAALTALQQGPDGPIEVGGNTDNVGKKDYNMKLSLARANTVRDWLIANGMDGDKLTAQGYGDTNPVVPNDSDAHRAMNRRVELTRLDCK